MKNREGFISIICLIVMSVLIIMILYLEDTTRLGHLILSSTSNNIQSYYCAEGKIYMILQEEKYYIDQLYPILTEYFRNLPITRPTKDIIISKDDLASGDEIDRVKVKLIDKGDRKELQLISKSNFNGLRTTVTSNIKLFNEILEIEKGLIDPYSIEDKYKEDLDQLMVSISKDISINNCNKPENIFGMEIMNFSNIILDKKDNNNFEISCFRETMVLPYVERFNKREIFIIIRKFGDEPTNFFIGNSNTPNETIKLSGVLYIEGNVTISKDFEFNGILIVKDGEIRVAEDIKANIKGIIIADNVIYNDFIEISDIIYSRHLVYKYGTYLPGVIQPRINLIKSE